MAELIATSSFYWGEKKKKNQKHVDPAAGDDDDDEVAPRQRKKVDVDDNNGGDNDGDGFTSSSDDGDASEGRGGVVGGKANKLAALLKKGVKISSPKAEEQTFATEVPSLTAPALVAPIARADPPPNTTNTMEKNDNSQAEGETLRQQRDQESQPEPSSSTGGREQHGGALLTGGDVSTTNPFNPFETTFTFDTPATSQGPAAPWPLPPRFGFEHPLSSSVTEPHAVETEVPAAEAEAKGEKEDMSMSTEPMVDAKRTEPVEQHPEKNTDGEQTTTPQVSSGAAATTSAGSSGAVAGFIHEDYSSAEKKKKEEEEEQEMHRARATELLDNRTAAVEAASLIDRDGDGDSTGYTMGKQYDGDGDEAVLLRKDNTTCILGEVSMPLHEYESPGVVVHTAVPSVDQSESNKMAQDASGSVQSAFKVQIEEDELRWPAPPPTLPPLYVLSGHHDLNRGAASCEPHASLLLASSTTMSATALMPSRSTTTTRLDNDEVVVAVSNDSRVRRWDELMMSLDRLKRQQQQTAAMTMTMIGMMQSNDNTNGSTSNGAVLRRRLSPY